MNRRPEVSTGTPLIERMRPFGTTIFAEMTGLATQHDAVNLGQGFPDTDGPVEVLRAAQQAIAHGRNQYPPAAGFPELRDAVAAHQHHWYGIDLDPATQVQVTMGATEAIAATVLALCEPGDEVVLLEPYYDSYAAITALAGAVRKTVVLRFPEFTVDADALRAAFSPRTRLVLVNNPHNPTGKVFSRAELELIGRIAAEHDAWIVCDEVYEHLTFDGVRHLPMATLPGLADRVITISSAAKTFSVTGWKIGWVTGPARAVEAVSAVKQFLSFSGGGPFQVGVTTGLALPDAVFGALQAELQAKRDLLVAGLTDVGLPVSVPAGTYFVIADTAPLGVVDALQFCRDLPATIGVAAIPVSVFHDDPDAARSLVRLAYCKRDKVLTEGVRRLHRLAGSAHQSCS